MDEPMTPPINAWLELEGSPKSHVIRFHVIAPTSPARITSSVIVLGSTMSFAIVAATLSETNAPAKLRIAAIRTAVRGESALVEIDGGDGVRRVVEAVREVEEERDRDDRDESRVHAYWLLTRMLAITLAAVSHASSARSSPS